MPSPLTAKEEKKATQTIVATAIGLVLYMILIVYTSSTAQEIASEKGTKIMEVIFSSIKASEYFYGRMAGIFAVTLVILLLVWLLGKIGMRNSSENPKQ